MTGEEVTSLFGILGEILGVLFSLEFNLLGINFTVVGLIIMFMVLNLVTSTILRIIDKRDGGDSDD